MPELQGFRVRPQESATLLPVVVEAAVVRLSVNLALQAPRFTDCLELHLAAEEARAISTTHTPEAPLVLLQQ
jgi:hypothetical protein